MLIVVVALLGLAGCFRPTGPVAVLSSAAISGPAPLEVSFNLSNSSHASGRSVSFSLSFGDGSDAATGTDLGIAVRHTYHVGGEYTATLILTDDRGEQAIDQLTIMVSEEGPPVGTAVGETAPDFTAPTIGGGEITLSDVRGSVILLDFWGAWCTPCRLSLPHLDDLVNRYGDQGLVVILISTDALEQTSADYLSEEEFDRFISVWEPGAKFTPVAQLYGVLSGGNVGIPHTFLIDRQGVIRFRGHPTLDLDDSMVEALL